MTYAYNESNTVGIAMTSRKMTNRREVAWFDREQPNKNGGQSCGTWYISIGISKIRQ